MAAANLEPRRAQIRVKREASIQTRSCISVFGNRLCELTSTRARTHTPAPSHGGRECSAVCARLFIPLNSTSSTLLAGTVRVLGARPVHSEQIQFIPNTVYTYIFFSVPRSASSFPIHSRVRSTVQRQRESCARDSALRRKITHISIFFVLSRPAVR